MTTENGFTNPVTRAFALSEGVPTEIAKRRYWNNRKTPTAITEVCALDNLPAASRVFMVNMPRAGDLDRLVAGHECETFLDGHYPVVRVDGRTVTDAAQWFGPGAVPELANEAWAWVEAAIGRAWKDPSVVLLSTPGTTGRDLWLRTHAADGCPVMPGPLQDLVRGTSAQGRIETYPGPSPLAGFYEYDMRVAYAAVLRGMPMGTPEHRNPSQDEIVEGVRCRVEVRFRPPTGWGHVGLLAVRADDGSLSWPTTDEWYGPTWADGCEVALAIREGWAVEVVNGLVWPRQGDPLRTWADRLLAVLKDAEMVERLGAYGRRVPGPNPLYPHIRAMVRAIILHTVGAFHGSPQRVTKRAGDLDGAPIGADMLRVHDDGSVSWRETRAAAWPEACHPEWSSHIWARNRVRLLRNPAGGGMLTVPAAHLVAVRTDAVYTSEPTGWETGDDGKPGRWVLKSAVTGPVERPLTGLDVIDTRGGR